LQERPHPRPRSHAQEAEPDAPPPASLRLAALASLVSGAVVLVSALLLFLGPSRDAAVVPSAGALDYGLVAILVLDVAALLLLLGGGGLLARRAWSWWPALIGHAVVLLVDLRFAAFLLDGLNLDHPRARGILLEVAWRYALPMALALLSIALLATRRLRAAIGRVHAPYRRRRGATHRI